MCLKVLKIYDYVRSLSLYVDDLSAKAGGLNLAHGDATCA